MAYNTVEFKGGSKVNNRIGGDIFRKGEIYYMAIETGTSGTTDGYMLVTLHEGNRWDEKHRTLQGWIEEGFEHIGPCNITLKPL